MWDEARHIEIVAKAVEEELGGDLGYGPWTLVWWWMQNDPDPLRRITVTNSWAEANLIHEQRLVSKGLTFRRCFANAAMCSPSRATLFTGLYPTQHLVQHTLTYGGTLLRGRCLRRPCPIWRRCSRGGYNVVLGKWHRASTPTATHRTPDVAAPVSTSGTPTAGEGSSSLTSAAVADNDSDTVAQSLCLETQKVPGRTTPLPRRFARQSTTC
jgi:arylsulfatase A-like enzyme